MNNRDDLSNIILMLEELEDHVLSIVQKMMKHVAQVTSFHHKQFMYRRKVEGFPKFQKGNVSVINRG